MIWIEEYDYWVERALRERTQRRRSSAMTGYEEIIAMRAAANGLEPEYEIWLARYRRECDQRRLAPHPHAPVPRPHPQPHPPHPNPGAALEDGDAEPDRYIY